MEKSSFQIYRLFSIKWSCENLPATVRDRKRGFSLVRVNLIVGESVWAKSTKYAGIKFDWRESIMRNNQRSNN
jgi:hypothetical protein